jgi:hypothetical protein
MTYGNRGANGAVIAVTTKQGKSGKMTYRSFDSYSGVRDILSRAEMANASQYVIYKVNEAGKKRLFIDNDPPMTTTVHLVLYQRIRPDTNWLDEITRTD